jgi:valyl-tRNA synthetase
MNLEQDETAVELIRFAGQHLPPERFDHFATLIYRLLENHNQQLLDQVVDYQLLADKTKRLAQQRTTFLHILNAIVRDCPMFSPEVAEALRPHLLTFRRFIEEHDAPEPSEQEIRESLEQTMRRQ